MFYGSCIIYWYFSISVELKHTDSQLFHSINYYRIKHSDIGLIRNSSMAVPFINVALEIPLLPKTLTCSHACKVRTERKIYT